MQILRARLASIEESLAHQVAIFMQNCQENLMKRPGISENLDWAEALLKLNCKVLDPDTIEQMLGCILKYHEDIQMFKTNILTDADKRSRFLTATANHHAG